MKKLDFGRTVSILANLGVIAGIIFLAIEIAQNNQLLRAQAIGTVFDTRLARQQSVLSSDSLVVALAKNQRGEALTDEDVIKLNASFYQTLLGRQRDYFLYREGILTEEEFRANFPLIRSTTRDTQGTSSGSDFWEFSKGVSASPAYVEFVEQCILSDCEYIPR